MDEQLKLIFEEVRASLPLREPAPAAAASPPDEAPGQRRDGAAAIAAPGGADRAELEEACLFCPRPRTRRPSFVTCGSLRCLIRLQERIEKEKEGHDGTE